MLALVYVTASALGAVALSVNGIVPPITAAIIGATVLAVLVNIIELLCTAGLPAMYTGILTMQKYPPWENYLYLLLYIAAYMFDDSVMVAIAVVTLGKNKLQERGGRILKLLSGIVIAGFGSGAARQRNSHPAGYICRRGLRLSGSSSWWRSSCTR